MNNENQIFRYNGSPISFQKGDSVMVNATEMAKPFRKQPVFWLNNQSTKEFLNELSKLRNLSLADLVNVIKGGNNPGTWMHKDVALEFARWLSPMFAIWCNDRIEELLTKGHTEIHQDSEPSTPVLTNTFDISNLTGRPHARIMKDIRKIMEQGAGMDNFTLRYRPVETECGTRDYESYDITPKGMLILATGYPPLLRDRIAARLMEILRGENAGTGMYPVPTPEGMTAEAVREYERRNTELWRIIEEKNRIIDGLKAGKQTAGELSPLPEDKPQLHETAGGRINRSIARPHYPGTYLVNDMRYALMNERGICLRSRDIFRWLRREGWLISDGSAYNKPSEMAVRNGWMLPAVGNGKRNTGKSHFTPRLTESGYRMFVETVMRKGGVL